MMTTTKLHPPLTSADLRRADLTVADAMRTDFRSCQMGTLIAEVAAALHQSRSPFLPVTRAQVPVGVVSEGRIATALGEHRGDVSRLAAGEIMDSEVFTISRDALLADAVNRLPDCAGMLLAVDVDGLLEGVLTLSELAPELTEFALGRLVGQLVRQAAEQSAAVGSARRADPTAEIKPSKSQAQPHAWDSPTGAHPEPVSLVTPSDLVNPMLRVSDIMTSAPRTCSQVSTALEAALVFRDADCGAIPITEDGCPVGMVTDRDVALALADEAADLPVTPVERLMSRDVVTITTDAPLDAAIDSLRHHGLRRLVVVDSDGRVTGMLSLTDLAPHLSDRGLGHTVAAILGHRGADPV